LLTWNPICLLNFHVFGCCDHAVYLPIGSPRVNHYLLIDRIFISYRLTKDEEPETREEPRSHKVNAVTARRVKMRSKCQFLYGLIASRIFTVSVYWGYSNKGT
jgi:hypothetical protein